jgi:microcystin-dependent protein
VEPGEVCRVLRIPAWLLPMVDGALGLLCCERNWEQFGDMEPVECSMAAWEMWLQFTSPEACPMIGTVLSYATDELPDGVLPCDGAVYNRVDYPILYDRIAAVFIIDENTFQTPNIANRFVMGGGTVGETGGEEAHALTIAEMPSHTHSFENGYGNDVAGGYLGAIEAMVPMPTHHDMTLTGGGEAHENRPPYIRLRYGIIAA